MSTSIQATTSLTISGADPRKVDAATAFASNLSDIGASFILPKAGLTPAFGMTSAKAETAYSVGNNTQEVANWGAGPLCQSAIPVINKNERILIDNSHGLQSSTSVRFNEVQMGKHGDLSTKYLYTVDQRGVNIVPEQTPIGNRSVVKHTNVSSEASIGGEAWFGPNNSVTINAGSGRFGDGAGITQPQWNATVKLWESLGYKVNAIPTNQR